MGLSELSCEISRLVSLEDAAGSVAEKARLRDERIRASWGRGDSGRDTFMIRTNERYNEASSS